MDKNSFTAKSMPAGAAPTAALRAAPSFLVEQGQMATANIRGTAPAATKPAPTLVAPKPVVAKQIPALIQVQQVHDIIKLQELKEKQPDAKIPELEDLEPALVCFVKFVNKMKYSTKYTDDTHEYRCVPMHLPQAFRFATIAKDVN